MAFDFELFKAKMSTIDSVGGFDKNLELSFLKEGKHIKYLPFAYVYDEKVQFRDAFLNQRKRWLSAQMYYLRMYLKDVPKAIKSGNIDFCNKYFQQITIPRVILFGVLFLIALFMSIFFPMYALKWGILFLVFCLVLVISIPRKLFNRRLLYASMDLPKVFFLMIVNLFKLRGANRKFIHTPHGINHSSK
jgi:cellulose synthase/poly-beta-1,6-N-acetylglucosamine synthase-like glycosyltransferase